MDIQESILSTFFEKLEELEGFPEAITQKLRELWEEDNLGSKLAIRQAISRGTQHGSKD